MKSKKNKEIKNKKKISKFSKIIIIILLISVVITLSIVVLAKIGYFNNDWKLLKTDRKVYTSSVPSYVPIGFKYVEGTINTGYVIEDEKGNQFVLVPVDGDKIKLERKNFDKVLGQIKENDCKDEGLDEFLQSVNDNKGFYVARYEAGNEGGIFTLKGDFVSSIDGGILVSKKDVNAWTNVSDSDAKTMAQGMYNYSKVSVHSDLINSYAWDTICNWLSDVANINNKNIAYINDSTGMGNYTNLSTLYNTVVSKTGSNVSYKVKNIYDLAGNVGEISTEKITSDNTTIIRGGLYTLTGNISVASRLKYSEKNDLCGFRVILYK